MGIFKWILVVTCLSFFCIRAFSQEASNGNVIFKYKKYEKFNLGDMSIKGDVITPGDISVKKRKFIKFEEGLFDRKNFKDLVRKDIRDLR